MRSILCLASCLWLSASASGWGQTEGGAEADAEAAELERRLEAARERLEQAAREVAELSGRLVGEGAIEFVHRLPAQLPAMPRRAMLGLEVGPADGGVEVLGVSPGGPAARAGLIAGDLLIALDGRSLQAGETLELEIVRRGERQLLEVELPDRSEPVEPPPERD